MADTEDVPREPAALIGGRGRPGAALAATAAAGAASLAVEVVVGRILAASVGFSLYSWTSTIGVVLAGTALGAFVGGRLADRRRPKAMLARALVAGAYTIVASAVVAEAAGPIATLVAMPHAGRVLVAAVLLAFVPSVLLGLVVPLAFRHELLASSAPAATVGRVQAATTVGALAGIVLAGSVLIPLFGTRATLLVSSLLALGGAWALVGPSRVSPAGYLAGAAPPVLAAALMAIGFLDSGCTRESAYYCIRIVDAEVSPSRWTRAMVLDVLAESYNDITDPLYLEYDYLKIGAEISSLVARDNPQFNALFLGGAGYTLPRYIDARFAQARSHVIEIDPVVTEVSRGAMGLSQVSPRLRITHGDARAVLAAAPASERYDLIFGDTVVGFSAPYHLTTREFAHLVGAHLEPDGWYVATVVDEFDRGSLLRAWVATLRQVFPSVQVAGSRLYWLSDQRVPFLVVAGQRPVDPERLQDVQQLGASVAVFLSERELDEWMARRPSVILSDDYAPVEQLLLPIIDRAEPFVPPG